MHWCTVLPIVTSVDNRGATQNNDNLQCWATGRLVTTSLAVKWLTDCSVYRLTLTREWCRQYIIKTLLGLIYVYSCRSRAE